MPSTIWDFCYLDSETLALIEQIPSGANNVANSSSTEIAINEPKLEGTSGTSQDDSASLGAAARSHLKICGLQDAINDAEAACRTSLTVLDEITHTLGDISNDYEDVTGRTNSLMMNCENLLEQQHTYQQTVEILKVTLEPFNDIEELSALLGIPFDPKTTYNPSRIGDPAGNNKNRKHARGGRNDSLMVGSVNSGSLGGSSMIDSVPAGGTAVDPRSVEFKQILERLAKAATYLKSHHDILDKSRYQIWLENLENRAMSLIGKAMRELIEKASKSCSDLYQQKLYQSSGQHHSTTRFGGATKHNTQSTIAVAGSAASSTGTASGMGVGGGSIGARYGLGDDLPIESAAVYQKFRGLGYRLRELSSLLVKGKFAESVQSSHYHRQNSVKHFLRKHQEHATLSGRQLSLQSHHHRQHHHHHRSSGNLGSGSSESTLATASDDGVAAVMTDPNVTLEVPVISEVKQGYVAVRSELLLPFIKDMWLAALEDKSAAAANSAAAATTAATATESAGGAAAAAATAVESISLCSGIRQAFSTLLRVTQLEQQLFESLFAVSLSSNPQQQQSATTPATGSATATTGGASSSSSSSAAVGVGGRSSSFDTIEDNSSLTSSLQHHHHQQQQHNHNLHQNKREHTEVLSIIQSLSNATKDVLRPFIIRESEVDELCRVVSALSEDVRSQMLAMPVPSMILRQLLRGLDGTVSDAKERLSYCAEMKLRQEVQLFEPLPSHLAYPDILETYQQYLATVASQSTTTTIAAGRGGGRTGSATGQQQQQDTGKPDSELGVTDVYQTWYPPMRQALSLLSKLYGVVEMGVFEDFARRAVDLCVHSLKSGSEGVRRNRPGIHGDLFLVRHLLILREQLVPFELRMQSVEKHLDFSPTGSALQHLIRNAQSMWRFDEANGFLELARSGVPRMQETQIDVKRDLDAALKKACFSLKHSAVKMLLGGMDAFLAKVTAFVGTIPTTVAAAAEAAGAPNDNNSTTTTTTTTTTTNNNNTDTAMEGAAAATTGGIVLAANSEQNKTPLLPAAACTRLKNQAFVRADRIKQMLEGVQSVLLQRVPDLKAVMTLYIDNSVARTILLKPILQDFEETKRKMDCVIASCLDPGQPRRDLEHLLQTISMTVIADLMQ